MKRFCAGWQSIVPRARAHVFRLFPSPLVLHQEMKAAPTAEIAAKVVLVSDRVSMIRVEPDRRKIKSAAGGFPRIIRSRWGRLPDASARNTRFSGKVIRHF